MRTIDNGWAVMICDLDLVIIETLVAVNMPLRIAEESPVHGWILKDNYSRFISFSDQLKLRKKAFGYEISVLDSENKPTILNFNGIESNGHYIIAIFQNFLEFYECLFGSKDERLILLKEALKANYIEAANNMKDRIFSVIGHDLRAPLASVIGYMNLMSLDQSTFDSLREDQSFDLLKLSAGNSMILLENLLEWSRCQIGEITFNPVNINLVHLMRDVVTQFKEVTHMKKLTIFEVYLEEPMVYLDQRMIGTVLRNLISNAVKFSNQGGHIYVKIYVEALDVILTVSDEGIGMSEERLGELFKSSINSVIPGTFGEKGVGFGLSLCKRFVDENKGSISISSALGEGTTVTITISNTMTKEK